MVKRLVLVVACLAAVSACGGDKEITVGGNNGGNNGNNGGNNGNNGSNNGGSNNGTANNGMSNNGTNNGGTNNGTANNGMPDMSPDMTPDMPPPVDMGPDMPPPVDMGPDMPPPVDMGPDMPVDMGDPNCPNDRLGYGAPCSCDGQCITGVCLDATANSDGFCSNLCTDRSQCLGGADACVQVQGRNFSACRDDDTGMSCDSNGSDPSMCSSHACVRAGGSNYPIRFFCSVPCGQDSDCQNPGAQPGTGHSCSPMRCRQEMGGLGCLPTVVIQSAGAQKPQLLTAYPMEQSFCMPIGTGNPCDLATDKNACASGLCDPLSDRCTGQCLDAGDCPVGGCIDVDVSDAQIPIRACQF